MAEPRACDVRRRLATGSRDKSVARPAVSETFETDPTSSWLKTSHECALSGVGTSGRNGDLDVYAVLHLRCDGGAAFWWWDVQMCG